MAKSLSKLVAKFQPFLFDEHLFGVKHSINRVASADITSKPSMVLKYGSSISIDNDVSYVDVSLHI